MRVMADNDVIGVVEFLRRILESSGLAGLRDPGGLELIDFEELGLPNHATDRTVWQTCQASNVVLITGNRTGGADSLDRTIRDLADPLSLPVLTIADVQRVLSDRVYAEDTALGMLDFLERIDELRGTGRLYIP